MRLQRLAALALGAAVGVGALTGCGSESGDSVTADPTRSPDLFYEVIENTLANSHSLKPANLAQALPNQTIWATEAKGERIEAQFSDAVIAGTVVKVEPLRAKVWIDTEEETYDSVDFDDPNASGREVSVTMKVTDALGVKATDGQFSFTIGVIGDGVRDPYAYMESLRGLGDFVVVLERVEAGDNAGEYIPAMAAGLIGQISEDGSLSFPALGDEEKEFVHGLNTLDALLAEAKKPTVMIDFDAQHASFTAEEDGR